MGKLVIDGNSVYEIDEDCMRRRGNPEKRHKEKGEAYEEGYGRKNPHRRR